MYSLQSKKHDFNGKTFFPPILNSFTLNQKKKKLSIKNKLTSTIYTSAVIHLTTLLHVSITQTVKLDQIEETIGRVHLSDERLGSSGALRGVAHQHPVEKALESGRDAVHGVAEPGRRHVPDEPHGLEGRLVEIGRLAIDHLNDHDAQRPDVHLGAIGQPRYDLGRHPVRRADQRLSFLQVGAHLGHKAKVGELDSSVTGQQDRVGLNVPVNDSVGVQKGERPQHALAHRGYLGLVHAALGHNVGEGAARQILHHHPELVLHQKTSVHVHNILVLVVAHYDHLVEEELAPLLFVQVHFFDGHQVIGIGRVVGRIDHAGGALANFDEIFESEARVARVHHHLERVSELVVAQAVAGRLATRRTLHQAVLAAQILLHRSQYGLGLGLHGWLVHWSGCFAHAIYIVDVFDAFLRVLWPLLGAAEAQGALDQGHDRAQLVRGVFGGRDAGGGVGGGGGGGGVGAADYGLEAAELAGRYAGRVHDGLGPALARQKALLAVLLQE
ncbi:hypothetical protein BpHYR1_020450 [Brachionus plicatilis]|uniref:Uncharacterized protein n=1 Tax=Brachionus plicatilis TaxID=10195 RepID=A0A3M7PXL3_BRAPC|nr:hypothetical protein BpHYR1_020450 [Brachionus plicatilis]